MNLKDLTMVAQAAEKAGFEVDYNNNTFTFDYAPYSDGVAYEFQVEANDASDLKYEVLDIFNDFDVEDETDLYAQSGDFGDYDSLYDYMEEARDAVGRLVGYLI